VGAWGHAFWNNGHNDWQSSGGLAELNEEEEFHI
jgi:hypothetical protein